MTPIKYSLTTLDDVYQKVPADRIMDCMTEMAKLMAATKETAEMIYTIAEMKAKEDGKELEPVSKCFGFKFPMTWIDDGKGELTTKFSSGDKPWFDLSITKKKPK